ncbi:MAG: NAD(P)/FAD-dependent oxidoreductase [Marivita sp.]|uniref:flavin-containing monooxygenase n=1 Tax=Marivita sp. TaxID=2003365 RepID=UPI0025B8784C|nr:NAD(P)/FAD-dependent oxidoreductase [Marivita sp.]MCI5112181.1 NAD(P)/FAD-dependent oxidoreductase [Marivita sp.]
MEEIDTVVVGAGQAGVAMSEHLTHLDIPHVVLERARIAERWRTERWDSLVANGPAWHDRFPNMAFGCDDDAFPDKESVAAYFEAYAKRFNAPIRTGVDVTAVTPKDGGFVVQTSKGTIRARHVVAATGPFQKPAIPPVVPADAGPLQLHSNAYRNPAQLPQGAVLVVGGGSSGVQIAEELMEAGREVYLSIGPHDRPPRRYRGRDNVWWLGVLGKWNADSPGPGTEHVTIAVSGAHGGKTIDFRALAHRGMTLMGMTEGYSDGVVRFADDLKTNLQAGDANYLSVLDEADAYIAKHGLDLPLEPEARTIPDDPTCVTDPIREIDLAEAGIGTILWATGYQFDFGWIKADTFDDKGRPLHQRGVSREPGLYFVGLPWQTRRGSSFIWGVWHDAKFIADQIAIQRGYMAYQGCAAIRVPEDA